MNFVARAFLRGAVLLLPVLVTLWLIWALLTSLDNLGVGALHLLGWDGAWPGSGILTIVALMFLGGTLFRINPISWLYDRVEKAFLQAPLIKTVYSAIRDFVRLMDADKREFKQTVLVDVPTLGPLVGFVTAEHLPPAATAGLPDGDSRVPVYLPMSYMVGGYTLFIERDRIRPVDWRFEDAMRFVMTAGVSGTEG